MPTTNDSAAPALLPIGYTNYTITSVNAATVLCAFDGSTEVDCLQGVSGNQTLSLPYAFDGVLDSLSIKLRNYLDTWDDHTVSFNQYDISYESKQATNTEITETTLATVQAYTTLETIYKIYDYVTYFGTLESNLLFNRLCTKTGTSLDFGSYDLVIDNTAPSPLTKVGNTVTIKATAINGGSITTTGTITFAGASVTGTTSLTGSNGVSGVLTIQGLTDCAVYVKNNSGTQHDYNASVTGTYTSIIPFGSTGTWTAVTKPKGYRHAYYNFDASV